MKKIALLLALVWCVATQAQVMRTIIFSDTNDANIGRGCASDVSEMSAFGIQLATALGMSSSYEPQYWIKKAEGYQREASYYTNKGDIDRANTQTRYAREAMDKAKTQQRYAKEADEKAAMYLRRASQ